MIKEKKVLCICSSVYQVITLTQIIKCFYRNDIVDIIFTNYMEKYESIAREFQKTDICRYAYAINVDCVRYKADASISETLFCSKEVYNEMLIHNFGNVCTYFVNSLEKKLKTQVVLTLYEDGLASYSKIYERYYADASTRLKEIQQIYAFEPKYFDWIPPFKIIRIPKISIDNVENILLLNKVFKYTYHITDCSPIIYVESIAGLYGYDLQEKEILKQIVQAIGKEKIIIKKHPRNFDCQIDELNYLDNELKFVPFELILLNQNLNKRILLTISSNGVYSAATMFDISITAISLLNCMENRPDIIEKELKCCINKIHEQNSNSFYMAKDINDAINCIRQHLGE